MFEGDRLLWVVLEDRGSSVYRGEGVGLDQQETILTKPASTLSHNTLSATVQLHIASSI